MKQIAKEAITLGLLMLDSENGPPQPSQQQAFSKLQELRGQFVTRAGAGGRALSLKESEEVSMPTEEEIKAAKELEESKQKELEEAQLKEKEGSGKAPPTAPSLPTERMQELVDATNLPDPSKTRLSEGQYDDEAALTTIIEAEVAYVKVLTGSGKPFSQGGTTPPNEPAQLTEQEKTDRFNGFMREVGSREV